MNPDRDTRNSTFAVEVRGDGVDGAPRSTQPSGDPDEPSPASAASVFDASLEVDRTGHPELFTLTAHRI